MPDIEAIRNMESTRGKKTDKFSVNFVYRFYSLFFMLFFLLYVFIPILAPILLHAGYRNSAYIIYKFFGNFCHQLPYRTFFLYGKQICYPLSIASEGFQFSFEKIITTNKIILPISLKQFYGNEVMGYKTALCQRDIAIFFSISLFCLIFFISNNKIKRINWKIWFLLGVIPMAVDGFSQLAGRVLPNLFLIRESTPLIRVITGFSFGFMTAWYLIPYIGDSLLKENESKYL